MLTTNDEMIWKKAWAFKDHGKAWDTVYNQKHSPGFRWIHESFGTNWRMTEMQAVIGRIQLKRMREWHDRRINNVRKIWNKAAELSGLRVPVLPAEIEHAAYKCYVFVEPDELNKGWGRDRIMREINARGVPCYSGSCSEVYLEKSFEGTELRPIKRLPVARKLGETSLMFLVHPTLTVEEIEMTCSVIREVMSVAAGKYSGI